MNDRPTIRLRTAELRARLNRMSQSELAKRAELSKTTVSNLESGRLRRIELETIGKLCMALSCTPNELFEITGQAEYDVAQKQRAALSELLGSLTYDKAVRAEDIDSDLLETLVREQPTLRRARRRERQS